MDITQNNLIYSLKLHPLIVVIRLEIDFFKNPYKKEELILKIKKLSNYGIKNIEIAWNSHPEWITLISAIKNDFPDINIGAASISSIEALNSILSLDINYSMSPIFNKETHVKAIEYNQLLIPGISNIEDFKKATNLGYKIIKIYPASKLGIDFLNKLKGFKEIEIFFIGAGGIKTKDINKLLKEGYNALAIGRELQNQNPDQDLKLWLENLHKGNSI